MSERNCTTITTGVRTKLTAVLKEYWSTQKELTTMALTFTLKELENVLMAIPENFKHSWTLQLLKGS